MRSKISVVIGLIFILVSGHSKAAVSKKEAASALLGNAPYFQTAFQKTRANMRLLSLDKLSELYFSENKKDVLKKRLKAYQKTILPSLKSGIANHEVISLNPNYKGLSQASDTLNISEYLSFVMLCEAKFFYLNSEREKTLSGILEVQEFMNAFSDISIGSVIEAKYHVHYALNSLILRMIYDAFNAKELEEVVVSLDKSRNTVEFSACILSLKSNTIQNISNILENQIQKTPENRKFKEKALKDLRSEAFIKKLNGVLEKIFQKAENISFVSVPYPQKKKALKTLQKNVLHEAQKIIQSSFPLPANQKKYSPIIENTLQDIVRRILKYYELSLMDISLNDLLTLTYLIKVHKLEHKKYPDKLSELTLSGFRIPRDRFSGKAYQFEKLSKKGFRLWGVGPDEKDNNAAQFISIDSGEGDIFLKPLNKIQSAS